jgi:hypothetical protein
MLTDIHAELAEKGVRVVAIFCIAAMEYQLIVTGQDGATLLPVAFFIGLIAGISVEKLKECVIIIKELKCFMNKKQ